MRVSWDFDSTLILWQWSAKVLDMVYVAPNHDAIAKIREHQALGDEVWIVTARRFQDGDRIASKKGLFFHPPFTRAAEGAVPMVHAFRDKFQLDIPDNRIVFTKGHLKGPFLRKLGIGLHYDDDEEERFSALEHGVQAKLPPGWPYPRLPLPKD